MSVNKMYEFISVMPNHFSQLVDQLNEKAAEGYKPIHFVDLHNQLVVILEFKPNKGRPRKEDEDNLGE